MTHHRFFQFVPRIFCLVLILFPVLPKLISLVLHGPDIAIIHLRRPSAKSGGKHRYAAGRLKERADLSHKAPGCLIFPAGGSCQQLFPSVLVHQGADLQMKGIELILVFHPEFTVHAACDGPHHRHGFFDQKPQIQRIFDESPLYAATLSTCARAESMLVPSLEIIRISVFIANPSSFNRQDISKAGYIEHFPHNFICVPDLHAILGDHGLVRRQQHAETCGRNVIQFGKVQRQSGHAVQVFLQYLLQFWRGGRIQPSLQGNGQPGFFPGHCDFHVFSLLFVISKSFTSKLQTYFLCFLFSLAMDASAVQLHVQSSFMAL